MADSVAWIEGANPIKGIMAKDIYQERVKEKTMMGKPIARALSISNIPRFRLGTEARMREPSRAPMPATLISNPILLALTFKTLSVKTGSNTLKGCPNIT